MLIMPRSMAPPPSGEFSVNLTKSFGPPTRSTLSSKFKTNIKSHVGKIPTEKVEIIGEPNRPANVKITNHVGKDNQTIVTKSGSIQQYVLHNIHLLLPSSEQSPFQYRYLYGCAWDRLLRLRANSKFGPSHPKFQFSVNRNRLCFVRIPSFKRSRYR